NAITVDAKEVHEYLKERFDVTVRDLADSKTVALDVLDTAADDFTRSSQMDSAMQGMLLGGGGALSIPFDVLTLTRAAVRLVQKVSILYGFGVNSDEEKAHVWIALAHASGITEVEHGQTRLVLTTIPSMMQNSPYSKVVIFKLLREILEQIPLKMGRSRLVPLLGGIMSAVGNYRYLQDVGARAKLIYRERHLPTRSLSE
ncbi:MAG: EcsC family protein, partial [Candidatus Xenobia bacterium]